MSFVDSLPAADWPAWRCNAARSAVTTEALAEDLHLLWSRSLGPNHVAWAEDARLQFDAAYEPIVIERKLIVASARNNSVTAFDTATGEEVWQLHLAVPVRLAPFAHRGKIYFGADDGKLYCLHAQTGEQLWSISAAPTDRLVLGNERLISVWPARGGVVVANDTAYFTVGVWPFEGCLLCKVNLNNDVPRLQTKLMEDVSPQGYLAVTGGRVLVPGGRGLVSCFHAETLESIPISYGSSGGTTEAYVAASDQVFFHGDAVFDFEINRQLNFRLKRPIADDRIVYGIRQCAIGEEKQVENPPAVFELVAYDLRAREAKESKDRRGNPVVKYHVPELWVQELPAFEDEVEQPPRLVLKASDRLYGVGRGRVFALDWKQGKEASAKDLTWQRKFESQPMSLVVADEKLFVVTVDGTIHCLGAKAQHPKIHSRPQASLTTGGVWSGKVREMLAISGAARGHCLVLGAGSGGLLTENLLHQSDLKLWVIEPNPERADALRRRLDDLDLYGTRATVLTGHPQGLALPSYMASLIASEEVARFGEIAETVEALYRVLRPYGGAMVFPNLPVEVEALSRAESDESLAKAKFTKGDSVAKLERVGALPGAADWTHEYGDPSNTLMSQDQLAKAPFGVLWFGGPASHGDLFFNRHYWGPGLTVIEGRMVVQGPKTLASIDIYTGELLWKKELREGTGPGRRGTFFEIENPGFHFTATNDAIYLLYPEVCLVLDPKTGETTAELRLPNEADQWGKVRVWEDKLIVAIFRQTEQGLLPKAVSAVNRHTGEVLWTKDARRSMPLMAVGGDRVYSFDGYLPGFYDAWKRRGLTPKSEGYRSLRTFDVHTGEEQWERSADRIATWMAYAPNHDILIVSNKQGVDAMDATEGNTMWKKSDEAPGFGGHPENVWDKVILSDDRIIDQRGPGKSYDIKTGNPIVHINPISLEQEDWQFTKTGHHCNYAIASPHLLTFRAGTAGFFDRASNTSGRLNGFRSGCRNSLIPAGGILNAPNYAHGCSCNYNLFTSLALMHLPEADLWTYNAYQSPKKSVAKLGINLGAPGDRLGDDGTLWLEYPTKQEPSPAVTIETEGDFKTFRIHSHLVKGEHRWIGSSGAEGILKLRITIQEANADQSYDVRLYFLEPQADAAGIRKFDVKLEDDFVIKGLDPHAEAGERSRVVVKEIKNVRVDGDLDIGLVPVIGKTLLCGVQITKVVKTTQ